MNFSSEQAFTHRHCLHYIRILIPAFVISNLLSLSLLAQQTTTRPNGVYTSDRSVHAFTDATIHISPSKQIEGATLIISSDKVLAVGKNIKIPADAIVHSAKGKHIYPAFIDMYSHYGVGAVEYPPVKPNRKLPQFVSTKIGAYSWNQALRPELSSASHFKIDKSTAESLRKVGFGTILTHQGEGIMRGSGSVVSLRTSTESKSFIKPEASFHLSFNRGKSTQMSPTSLTGAIGLIRQTYLDADWYAKYGKKEETNLSLQSLNETKSFLQIFEVRDWQEILRAHKLGNEFSHSYIIKSTGDEYKRIEEIKKRRVKIITSLNFPKPYDVKTPYDRSFVELEDLKHWEVAPFNPRILHENKVPFVFTAYDLKNKKDFLKNIRIAVNKGLPRSAALSALTTTPAKWLKISSELGMIKKGYIASFFVADGDIFEDKTSIEQSWVQGTPYVIKKDELKSASGHYITSIDGKTFSLSIDSKKGKPTLKAKLITGGDTLDLKKSKISINYKTLSIRIPLDTPSSDVMYASLVGRYSDATKSIDGHGQLSTGQEFEWTATSTPSEINRSTDKKKKEDKKENPSLPTITYPNKAYGTETPYKQQTIMIKNATVWTNEKEGIMEYADVFISNGKISAIGRHLFPPQDALIIDGTGKHLTSGIIDEHSHIAISKGVNEAAENNASHVRIGDVINSEDVNIYRHLSGGVSAVQLLHGSANPIGGQSALIKLRWGKTPEQMKIKNADGFIKFALGENVKQANWGDNYTIRFPQTRMGVEQTFRDAFTQAQEYKQKWAAYRKNRRKYARPRKDLRLDAMAEIIDKKRFISCHSYVQSEINMLMHVAEDFNFRVNTFTHILEGYKVADKMAKHGVGGSTFADWWAYKFEVREAIPYNPILMHDQGVVVAINSDDAEMARRLNHEAAKSIKYGGMNEEDAWKMVTLNPAKLLHLDDRMGSIKVGKDADVVLWTASPLSVYAKVEKNIIDGVVYFDVERDKKLREVLASERNRLIEAMIMSKEKGASTQKVKPKAHTHYHCETVEDVY